MRICPICRQQYDAVPALSRKDNKTKICPICATQEALDEAGITGNGRLREDILLTVRSGYAAYGINVPRPGRAT